MTLSRLAHALVEEKGCRVLIFDLFGRGFSDNPSDLPHDARLYTTQILLALASSPHLSWIGPHAFKLVGYSLGGGIAVHFAAAFPHLISSLVLLAPAGLIRPESFGKLTRALFTSGLVPPGLLGRLASHKLRKPITPDGKKRPLPPPTPSAVASVTSYSVTTNGKLNGHANGHVNGYANGYTNGHINGYAKGTANGHANGKPKAPSPPHHPSNSITATSINPMEQQVSRAVHWQLDNHDGFVPAFLSCVQHGPLLSEHAAWARLAAVRAPGTTAVLLGEVDDLIDLEEYTSDALPLLGGHERVRWRVIRGAGHDFPMSHVRETLREMYEAWGWE
jgi:pimeloyl-ACP methyl ester carboxylesterase